MPFPTTFTGWSSLSMIGSPHLAQTRLVRWLSSSRLASDARAVFESSPFFGIDMRPLSPVYRLSMETLVVAVTMGSRPARIVSDTSIP
jgi:hypothetical protein